MYCSWHDPRRRETLSNWQLSVQHPQEDGKPLSHLRGKCFKIIILLLYLFFSSKLNLSVGQLVAVLSLLTHVTMLCPQAWGLGAFPRVFGHVTTGLECVSAMGPHHQRMCCVIRAQ